MKLKYCGSRSFLYTDTAPGHSLTTVSVMREGHKWYCSDSQEIASFVTLGGTTVAAGVPRATTQISVSLCK